MLTRSCEEQQRTNTISDQLGAITYHYTNHISNQLGVMFASPTDFTASSMLVFISCDTSDVRLFKRHFDKFLNDHV